MRTYSVRPAREGPAIVDSKYLLFERSEFLIATSKKKNLQFVRVSCVRLILVLVEKKTLVLVCTCTYYVPHTYVPGISRLPRYVYDTRYVLCTRYVYTWYQPATQIRMYLVSAGRRTFRPWTHTPDDSYMYQLSLVVATAAVSFYRGWTSNSTKSQSASRDAFSTTNDKMMRGYLCLRILVSTL